VSKKTRRARNAQYSEQQQNHVIDFSKFKKRENRVTILPRNLAQEDYLALFDDPTKDIIFATGPAGTGKTIIAVLAAIRALKTREVDKIVVTRPAVSVDEQHGFLPGTLVDKMAPWTRPIFDIFEDYYSPKEIETMMMENIIEIAPLAFMRGRTFRNAIIIFDEAQNSTPNQMEMILTRIGKNSRMFITGDLHQHDKGYDKNGLDDFINKFKQTECEYIGLVQFTKSDIERHPIVTAVLNIYNKD
jgi:phosphate starvation-inducible PhoH-like protein